MISDISDPFLAADEFLDEEQKAAVDTALHSTHDVVRITGRAGTGKSTVIEAMGEYGNICKSATTGKAAILVGGMTVDSLFCFSRRDNEPYRDRNKDIRSWNMRCIPDTIVIDEASMMGHHMAEFIFEEAMRYGKRIVLVGDWAQAMPVADAWPVKSRMFQGMHTVKLTTAHRQKEKDYLDALEDIRNGKVTERVRDVFLDRITIGPPEGDEYVRLFATNKATDGYNLQRISHFENRGVAQAIARDVRPAYLEGNKKALPPEMLERYAKDSPFSHGDTSVFSIGCRVVVTMNEPICFDPKDKKGWGLMDPVEAAKCRRYINGDTGTVVEWEWTQVKDHWGRTGFNPTKIWVKIDRTGQVVCITPHIRIVPDAADRPFVEITGMPLVLGYAMTIHKSQGSTVEKAYVDLDTITRFPRGCRHGLAYVALSRTKTLGGLLIANWADDAVELDPMVEGLI